MPAPTTEIEPIEAQSLKKLSLKSLKRSLELFSPVHGQFPPPDPEAKQIRLSHKMKVAFGGVEPVVSQPPRQPDRINEQPGPSNALSLAGVFHITMSW
jgi:pleiotropic regulator 1